MTSEVPRFFRIWFYAAAVYNLLWGCFVCLFPAWCIDFLKIGHLISVPFLQVIGMIVGVYAYGYWLLAKEPIRYYGLIWIGLLGKILGPLGFFFYAFQGTLPWNFGFTIITNDLIWWPVFIAFTVKYRTVSGSGNE